MTALDAGLARRFERAEEAIRWRPAPGGQGPDDRIAHLNDEEARVQLVDEGSTVCVTADPGPVGALVLMGEIGRRGDPTYLEALGHGPPPFENGALRACWGPLRPLPPGRPIPESDLIGVARFALP